MEESRVTPLLWWGIAIAIVGTCIILMFKSCNTPATDPAVDRLRNMNDSLYDIIERNNLIADSLFDKIDSLNISVDTVIAHQEVTNKYYTNETYTILNYCCYSVRKWAITTMYFTVIRFAVNLFHG